GCSRSFALGISGQNGGKIPPVAAVSGAVIPLNSWPSGVLQIFRRHSSSPAHILLSGPAFSAAPAAAAGAAGGVGAAGGAGAAPAPRPPAREPSRRPGPPATPTHRPAAVATRQIHLMTRLPTFPGRARARRPPVLCLFVGRANPGPSTINRVGGDTRIFRTLMVRLRRAIEWVLAGMRSFAGVTGVGGS